MIASLAFSLTENGIPLYEQLRQQLLDSIVDKRLQVGDKLPSSRALSQMLGVSRSVVMQTYDQLVAEGVLISQPKKGVFVAPQTLVQPPAPRLATQEPEKRLDHFDSGVDVSVFPNKEWAASMRRAWLNPDPKLLKGEYEAGYPALQQAICEYLYALRGVECRPEQIILLAGNHDALRLIQHALAEDVDQWLLETPTYPPLRESFAKQNCQYLTLNEQGCLPPEHSSRMAAVLTPSRQYPLGFSYGSAEREAWFGFLSERHNFVIEDDYDNEFLYQGSVSKPWFQAAQYREGARDQLFYIGSFSKVLFRGLRLGFIVSPVSKVPQILASQKALGLFASQTLQPVVTDFLKNGVFYRHLNRMRRHYRCKRDSLLRLLEQQLQPWFHWQKPTGGMHIVIFVKDEFSSQLWCRDLNRLCMQGGLRLSWLQQHYVVEDEAPKGLLLGFSAPSEEQLQAWIGRIAEACQELSRNPKGLSKLGVDKSK